MIKWLGNRSYYSNYSGTIPAKLIMTVDIAIIINNINIGAKLALDLNNITANDTSNISCTVT